MVWKLLADMPDRIYYFDSVLLLFLTKWSYYLSLQMKVSAQMSFFLQTE